MKFILSISDELIDAAKEKGAANNLVAANTVLYKVNMDEDSWQGQVKVISTYEWSKEDEAFLRKNWLKMTREEIAEKMGRTTSSVSTKAYRMNL